MKTFSIISVILLLLAAGCAGTRETAADGHEDGVISISGEKSDTTEYELAIFDPGFDRWFRQNYRPMSFYDQSYLERWNAQLVNQWNSLRGSTRLGDCMPGTYIDYRPTIDYGLELNYRLFYYFKYVHERCRIFRPAPGDWRR